mmetsp:Transcript_13234/g.16613  ORF Transcript_13234/g.16613 Transcript_13234/m.16613 type:complete len:421 (-) Transcript_13234:165-1427(-)
MDKANPQVALTLSGSEPICLLEWAFQSLSALRVDFCVHVRSSSLVFSSVASDNSVYYNIEISGDFKKSPQIPEGYTATCSGKSLRRILRTVFQEDKEEFESCIVLLSKDNRVIEVAVVLSSGESKLVSIPYKEQEESIAVVIPILPNSVRAPPGLWQQIVEKFPTHLQEATITITDRELTLQSYYNQYLGNVKKPITTVSVPAQEFEEYFTKPSERVQMIFTFDQFKVLIESVDAAFDQLVLNFGNSDQPMTVHVQESDTLSGDITFATIDCSEEQIPSAQETISSLLNKPQGTNSATASPVAVKYKTGPVTSLEDAANVIFGCNGWDSRIVQIVLDGIEESNANFTVGITAVVSVIVKGASHEECGYALVRNKNRFVAAHQAKIEAIKDARARALQLFGVHIENGVCFFPARLPYLQIL